MKGQIVYSPAGEEVVLADIGLVELLDTAAVRVWDVSLPPGGTHPWHLHHNPYVVLSLQGSEGRMDWLDGSEPRFIREYHGGAVYRPVSPVHRLTNLGDHDYQNRLVELKDLGELQSRPVNVGEGGRSIEGSRPGPQLADSREPVLLHPHVSIWTVHVEPGATAALELSDTPHVLASTDPAGDDVTGGVSVHPGGPLTLPNNSATRRGWFVVELTYLADLPQILKNDNL